jgi:outer membrane lipoprotein SlyB
LEFAPRFVVKLNRLFQTAVIAAGLFCSVTPASGQSHTADGVALGGVAGAIAGGIIGHQNDETPEGALIGGAVGAITGGVIGRSMDQQAAREHYYRQQLWQQRQQIDHQRQVIVEGQRAAVSTTDVVNMCRSGVSESVIINHIQANGVQRRLETHDIISLSQQGVSENILNAMQRAPLRTVPTTLAPQGATVIVREHHHVVPRHVPPARYYYRAYHHPPHYRVYPW